MRRLGLHGLVHWRLLGDRRQPLALAARRPGSRQVELGSWSGSGAAARPLAATLGADGALLLWAAHPLAPCAAVEPSAGASGPEGSAAGFTAVALLSEGEEPASLAAATASGVHMLRVEEAGCLMPPLKWDHASCSRCRMNFSSLPCRSPCQCA